MALCTQQNKTLKQNTLRVIKQLRKKWNKKILTSFVNWLPKHPQTSAFVLISVPATLLQSSPSTLQELPGFSSLGSTCPSLFSTVPLIQCKDTYTDCYTASFISSLLLSPYLPSCFPASLCHCNSWSHLLGNAQTFVISGFSTGKTTAIRNNNIQ